LLAPGLRPRRGAKQRYKRPIGRRHEFGPEFQIAAPVFVGLDDLDTLSGDSFLPLIASRLRKELLEGRELMARTLKHLADQIFGQPHIVACYVE
jgi:hypothetical protein